MLARKNSLEGKTAFADAEALFAHLDVDDAARLAMVAGDVALILDEMGTIIDGAAHPDHFPDLQRWIGVDWLDTVNIESKPKVMEMLAAARRGQTQHWRQVNHPTAEGNIPVRYALVALGKSRRVMAVGRDMRDAAALQQRLLQAQQSLERDYIRLRQIEMRYRLLFEHSSEPVVVVDSDSFKIREANPAAHKLLGVRQGALAGGKLLSLFARSDRENLLAFLGSAMASSTVSPVRMQLAKGSGEVALSATGFRQHGGQFLLVRLAVDEAAANADTIATLDVMESMPDAFVLADSEMNVLAANLAFVELVQVASADQIRGRHLSEFVGRPGIDLDLITGQLAKHGFTRNVSTIIASRQDDEGEPVELSAVRVGEGDPVYGFVLRSVGRRLRDLPPAGRDLPRSVEQLTELVGRMSLKDIVRESTDLIERLCIEAALSYTSDNRASAAEILGLSRQSLYSKLHRYGLGNLVNESDQ